jgi:hypothetical protein
MTTAAPLFPLEPLLSLTHAPSLNHAAKLIGVDRSVLYRAAKAGGFSLIVADRVATRFGRHPSEIWSEWFEVPA